MELLLVLAGIIVLFIGGESLIKGTVSIAINLKISKILVSSVIVGFGTSMPEMTISLQAMFQGSPEIAIGNIIGSNIANILLIIGLCALISPFSFKNLSSRRDIYAMLISIAVYFIFDLTGKVTFFNGLLMILGLCCYIIYSYFHDKKNFKDEDIKNIEQDLGMSQPYNIWKSFAMAIIGILLLVAGSSLFLKGATSLAQRFHISEEVIGLFVVALGSCLPELATSIIAALRKHTSVIVSAIVGSNIFNILSIGGAISLVEDVNIPSHIAMIDVPFLLITTCIFAFLLIKGVNFSRLYGLLFTATYVVYTYLLFI